MASTSAAAGSSSMSDWLSCSICQELLADPVTIPTGHTYCRACIAGWLKKKKICPLTNTAVDVDVAKLSTNYAMQSLVEQHKRVAFAPSAPPVPSIKESCTVAVESHKTWDVRCMGYSIPENHPFYVQAFKRMHYLSPHSRIEKKSKKYLFVPHCTLMVFLKAILMSERRIVIKPTGAQEAKFSRFLAYQGDKKKIPIDKLFDHTETVLVQDGVVEIEMAP